VGSCYCWQYARGQRAAACCRDAKRKQSLSGMCNDVIGCGRRREGCPQSPIAISGCRANERVDQPTVIHLIRGLHPHPVDFFFPRCCILHLLSL
jgi:hypothetical protein